MTLIPTPFLFRYTIPVQRHDRLPRSRPPLLELPENCRIEFPSVLEGGPRFADLRLAWNPHGLAVSISVTGKTGPPKCLPEAVLSSDRLQIWIDTRDTQSVHRATRFCHQFCLLPAGAGEDGKEPICRQLPVPRAREDAPEIDPESLLLESAVRKGGYHAAAWFPTDALHGFDPESHARLGFSACVIDGELGRQFLTVGEEFPVDADPSLWVSLALADSA